MNDNESEKKEEESAETSSEERLSEESGDKPEPFNMEAAYGSLEKRLIDLSEMMANLLELVDKMAPVTDSVGKSSEEAAEKEAVEMLEDLDYNLDD